MKRIFARRSLLPKGATIDNLGSVASIVGLLISIVTLAKVERVESENRRHSPT